MQAQLASGTNAAVVTGHPAATEAALQVIRFGGNAADAAIAGAAVLIVALPQACGLGGDCFILVHSEGQTYCLNGSGPSPAGLPKGLPPDKLARGPLSCSVPGMLGGWAALHERFGSMPWARLLEPAIRLAQDGMPASREFAAGLRDNAAQLELDPGCRTLFVPDGRAVEQGEHVVQHELASTLKIIAEEGPAAFYQGSIGQKICETLAVRGGALRQEDLHNYRPLWVEPLEYLYRGYAVRVAPPNSYGLVMLLQLAALSGIDLTTLEVGSPARLGLLMSAARIAFRAGDPLIADPRQVKDAVAGALTPSAVKELREQLTSEAHGTVGAPRANGTAVISVANRVGEGVTIVQSIFTPFGSGVADASTGVVLNNRLLGFSKIPGHPNAPGAGKRPAHTLNPAMVLKEGRLELLMGTPGGSGQTITLTQVLTSVIDRKSSLAQAISAPRWSMDIEGNFAVEKEVGPDVVSELVASGFDVRVAKPGQRFFFGSAECISVDPAGLITAVADFRREATAAAA